MYSFSQLSLLVISSVICLIAIFYSDSLPFLNSSSSSSSVYLTQNEQEQLLKTLMYETKRHTTATTTKKNQPRLAFCCSADLDVSVRAIELMEKVFQTDEQMHTSKIKKNKSKSTKPKPSKPLKRKHHERIGNLKELQESFAFYFANGAAAEQSMSSPEEFRQVVKFANEIPQVKHKVGGNAATMADRASVEGCKVLLGAAIGKEMRKHFNDNIQLVGHIQDHEHEDIHLVLEYSKGDQFRGHESPRANRYYLNHDIHNARLSVLEEFEQELETNFDADLVVIGGLQLMEVETDEQRRLERLKELSNVLQNLYLKEIPSHYEFAAVSDFTLFDDTVRLVLPWVNSIGLNEQELHILHHYIITGEEATATNSRPTVAQVTQQLSEVIAFSKQKTTTSTQNKFDHHPLGQLTRIHFHTLQFHIICQQTNEKSPWGNPTNALLQSALMSTKLACGKQNSLENHDPQKVIHSSEMDIDPERVEVLLPRKIHLHQKQSLYVNIDPFSPVISWEEQDFTCYLVPMLACKKPDHTAGLGDNISGTGMAYHSIVNKKK